MNKRGVFPGGVLPSIAMVSGVVFLLAGGAVWIQVHGENQQVLGETTSQHGQSSEGGQQNQNQNNNANGQVYPVIIYTTTPTTVVTQTVTDAPTQVVTVAPTDTITLTPPPPPQEVQIGNPVVNFFQPHEQQSNNSNTSVPVSAPTDNGSTGSQVDNAATVVRTFLQSIGASIKSKPKTTAPEQVTTKEKVLNERQIGDILNELQATVGTGAQQTLRLRFKDASGSATPTLLAETAVGHDVPVPADQASSIRQSLSDKAGLQVSNASQGGLVFSHGVIRARTNLPLLVDVNGNSLTAESSIGIRSVAVLPDTAMQTVIGSGQLTQVDPVPTILLVERADGKIAYQISGTVTRKALGLFTFKMNEMVEVSAESGRILPPLTNTLQETLASLLTQQVK